MEFISKILNKLSTYLPKDYSRVVAGIARSFSKNDYFPKFDEVITLLFYRFPIVRNKFLRINKPLPEKFSKVDSAFFDFAFTSEKLLQLQSDGILTGIKLKPQLAQEIKNHLSSIDINWDGSTITKDIDEIAKLTKADVSIAQAHYINPIRDGLISKMATDPALLSFASTYLRESELNLDVFAWWNFPVKKEDIKSNYFGDYNYAREFHFDHTSRRMFKIFIYLTDCDLQSGPHAYIKKSHLKRPLGISLRQANIDVESMKKYIPVDENWLTLTGEEGDCFAVDHYGMHCGIEPTHKSRLALQFMYSVEPLGKKSFSTFLNVKNFI